MSTESTPPFITPDALLAHWQGHRRLTRRVINAFPDDKLFSFSVGGMRPFGALALEMHHRSHRFIPTYLNLSVVSENSANTSATIQKRTMIFDSLQPISSK